MSRGARRWKRRLLISLVTAGLLWGGWQWSAALHYRRKVTLVEAELEEGLVSRAANHLVELSNLSTGMDEVAYLRGVCEKARGRQEAAAEAWASVPPDSAFAFRALEGLVELELENGRLSKTEQLIVRAMQDPRFRGQDPSILLGAIYSREGRIKEAKQLLEALWQRHNETGEAASETAINQLWLSIQLQSNPIADETIRTILEHAGEITPDDDRIWLWKANLAIRTKSYAEAGRLLDRCQARRPEGATAWRARLDWAVATNRVTIAKEALKHLPAAGSTPAEIENLTAWFAAQRGDDEAEQKSLERLIAIDPSDFAAVDRLIMLRVKNGQPDVADALRRRKDEIARLQSRYDKLFKRHQPRRDAAEMARLAEQLGRRFEARAFLTIALASNRNTPAIRNDLARLEQSNEKSASSGRTLEEQLLPQLADHTEKPVSAPRPQSHSDGAGPGG